MLDAELRGEPYTKAKHRQQLQGLLDGRSGPAIEFKHANISAVLIDLGRPYIAGYKPRSNYQHLLRTEIESRLANGIELDRIILTAVDAEAAAAAPPLTLDAVIVPVPVREQREATYERLKPKPAPATRINYLEREARNASLGRAGELFALEVEHKRLWEQGARELAERIEHVSATKGDGLGFDILSFDPDGKERLIEVKTTRFGQYTPFFASSNEVSVSADHPDQYALYRVFDFRVAPRLFIVPGSLRDLFDLEPIQFRASVA